jgi:uncharacterized damage-inducible protein DinB
MKQYLIEFFMFNDRANKTILEKIKLMPSPGDAVKLFTHMINSLNKWMARLTNAIGETDLLWFEAPYKLDELESHWSEVLKSWIDYLNARTEDELYNEIKFTSSEGKKLGALLKDITLQINYHQIHHRAQICMMLRKQGIQPPFIEYIGGVVHRY